MKKNILIAFFSLQSLVWGAAVEISSSSVLGNKQIYSHRNVYDGDPQTAWVEGHTGDGTNEWIKLEFDTVQHVTYLGLVNGYAKKSTKSKSDSIWFQNSRIKTAELIYSDGSTKKTIFEDTWKKQYIRIDRSTKSIKIVITSVYNGTKYKDACISEISPLINHGLHYGEQKSLKLPNSNQTEIIYYKEYEYMYNLGVIGITFWEGVYSFFGDEPNKNVITSDSIFRIGQHDLSFNNNLNFSLSSDTVKIVSVFKRIEYRHSFGIQDENSHYWLGALNGENHPDTSEGLISALSYYTPWRKIAPIGKKYEVFGADMKFKYNNIDSIETDIRPDKKLEKTEGEKFYRTLNNFWYGEFLKGGQWDLNIVSIKSVQFKITYLEKAVQKKLYIVLSNTYAP